MNKKFLAILMALAMIISLVPVAAMAAEEHTCEGGAWLPNGNQTHSSKCKICDAVVSEGVCHSFNGTTCYMCKGSMTPDEPECDHEGGAWISNGDGTHTSSCECGENKVSGECQDIGGKCYMCGYVFHTCDFEAGVTSNGDGTHNINCSCGSFVAVACSDNDGDGKCDSCGYQKYEPECKHEWKSVVNKDEATHNIVCRDCEEVLGVESHKYVDGRPCACGAIYVEDECKHEWKGVVNKDEATHNIVCRDCEEVLGVESHKYVDGRPCACGAIYVEDECKHEWKGVVNKDEGTHYIVCRDCEEVLGVESHKYVDGRPCACGAIYNHDCDFEAGVTSNEDGTHNVNCSCGAFVTIKCLDNDGDGKCDSCGYQKYIAPEDPTEEPTEEPTEKPEEPENNEGLDDAPKTGESIILVTFVAMMVIGLVGIVVYFLPRKKNI